MPQRSVSETAWALIDACPYTQRMRSAHKSLLAAMIAEELSKAREAGYIAGQQSQYEVTYVPIH